MMEYHHDVCIFVLVGSWINEILCKNAILADKFDCMHVESSIRSTLPLSFWPHELHVLALLETHDKSLRCAARCILVSERIH